MEGEEEDNKDHKGNRVDKDPEDKDREDKDREDKDRVDDGVYA